QTPGRKYPAPLFHRYPIENCLSDSPTSTEQNLIGYLVDIHQYETIKLLLGDHFVPRYNRYV
ncbi:MAG: hypothetical protein MUP73_01350, partial [Dehalococcoidia bacterium]|nr:hypothetical protein [Dehalococcoidia bacterium]